MIKKLISVIILILSFLLCYSQNNTNLYLIQGHVFDDLGGMFQFNSYLYKLNNKAIDTIVKLSSEKEYLRAIKVYPQYRKVVFYKDGWKENDEKRIAIIDYDKSDKVYWQKISYDNYGLIDGNLVNPQNNYFVFDLYSRKEIPKNIFLGIDIKELKEKTFSASVYKSVILNGVSGGVMRGEDYLMVYTNNLDGKLSIPKTSKIEDRPVFPLELPDSLQPKMKKMVLILINSENSFVVSMGASDPKPEQIGFTKLIIKDKKGDHWFSYKLKGNFQVMRCFGSWLAGSVVDENIRLILDEKGAVKDKEVFSRVSPGKEVRKREVTSSGTTFDIRADYLGVYYPGILYLLNVPTRKYLEWNTGQGDSEILLVQDENVYYRVNDEIFKAPILNGEKLGNSELLLKDFRVPDIHWAFFSNK